MRHNLRVPLVMLAIVGLVSAPVWAANIGESVSTGDQNVSTIEQTGDGEEGYVTQTGNNLVSAINQVVVANTASVTQKGHHNTSTATQQEGNMASVNQEGSYLVSTVNQDDSVNGLGRAVSKDNTAIVFQRGSYNTSTVNQNDDNTAEVTQTGIGAQAAANEVLINQFKNGDFAYVTQTGGEGNYTEINQNTCCGGETSDVVNTATSIQNGSFNSTVITQKALETSGPQALE